MSLPTPLNQTLRIILRILLPFVLATLGLIVFIGIFNVQIRVQAAGSVLYVSAATGSDVGDCKTQSAPCDTIAYALTQAASGEEIRVAQGTYVENLTVNQSVILRGGFSTSDWVDFAPTDNPTIIDGASSGRVLQVQNVTTITIEGFHVRNGLVNTGATPDEGSGAGINIINSGAIIRHNRIYENSTAVAGSIIYGGGIHVNTGASNVIIEHNEIYSNTVQTTLPNVGGGGGIGNQAPNTTIIRQNQIYDNSASGTLAFGGGVYNFNGLMDLSANTIYQNTADSVGGGLMNHGTATATIISNIIYDNQSSGGGGIYNIEGTAFVWNNTIVENVTTGSDGGGGIKNENGAVTISNTIIMSNTDNAGPNDIDFFDGGTIEAFYSRIDNIDAGTPFTSNNDVLVDPDFVDPAQNDFHLLDSSSMIDAGDPASAPAIDIDGQARPFGGDTAYDVGADEVYHSTTCFAQMANGTVLDNLQDAVNLASDGDTIKVAGYCTDEENDGSVLFINSKSITVRGGYTTTNWSSPSGSPTILDAENHGARRVVHLTGNATFTSTVEGFYITGGDIEENGGGVLVENGITAIIQNNFIYFNRVTDPMEGGDRNGAGIATSNSRAIIQFNTFYSNTNTVIYNDGAQPSIVNNLIIEHSDGAAINSANGILPEAIANNVIFNSGSEITFDGTLFGRTLPDAYGNIDVDPGLVDPENGDFHLQTTSPVIGQAGPEIVAITMDIDGDDRPQGDSSDIGADETIKYRQLLFNADQIGNADVGGAVTYTHILTNAGTFTESVGLGFTLSTGWDFAVSPVGPFTLDPGESTTFNMVITIPVVGVSPRDEAIAVFTATSQLESQVIATTQDTTFVNITPGAELTPNYDLNFDPGTEITVIHTLTNTGNYTDSYVISSSPITGSWGRLAVTSPYTIELGQLEAIAIPVIISVPHTALPKAENQNIFFITAARSDFGPDLTVTATNIIEANSIDGDRYVDIEQGFDEDNNCTVSDTPCKTIGHGLGLVTVSDAVFVARGTYSESGLIINNTIRLLGGYTSDFEEANRLMNPDETTIDGTGLGNRVILIGKNSPTIENFTIKGGDVSGLGGGIQVSEQASDPILRQLILTNNQATQGGGLYIGQDSAELANLVLFGNSATDSGGGIYLNNSDVTIQNLTLVENTASADGGGIYIAGGTTLVTNTLVASNTAGNDGGGIYQVAGSVDMNYNNFFANTATNNFDDSNIAFGSNSLFVVPHVDASRSMRLRITSPLIDIADPHTNNEIDFEGDLRPVDQGFDIGADEFAGCLAKIVRTDEIFGAIQEAIDAAITDDTIYVSGHCRGVTARLVAGQILSQTALITTNLTIIGGWDSIFENQNVIEPAIIDAETLGRSLVITGDITVQINHLKFINGDAAGLGGGPGDQDAGGNIYNHTSNANFHQIVVQEGTAEVGGGFYNVIGSPTFTNTSELILPNWFISNTATISGGGFYNQSGMPLFGNTRISGNDVTPSGVGGGFYNQNGQPQFTDNRNKIMLNQAESGAGFFNERGQPDLMNLTIVTNTATLNGGALFNLNNSPSYTVANLLLFHNNAMNGGAVYNTGRLNIWHTNLYSNSANTGGAVFQAAGALTVANTLVVSNFATTTSGGIHAAGGTFTLTHNNYFGNTNNDANVPLGEGHLTEDPLFLDPITPNSEDFELDPLSLVIDKGTDANFLKSDFTGTFRPSNQGYDIGARELGGCKAVINNDLSTIYNDVQSAVDAALSPTDVIRVHGHCRGVHTVEIDAQTYTQTIHLTKSLTLQGGWDETFTEQIAVTKLDALERGHVILIADPANVIVEHFDITGGLNGAIYNLSSISSTIQQNNFYSNTGTTGGAVYNDGGNIIIGGANRIYSNTVEFGTVLYSTGGTPRLQNNFIYSNTTTQNGTVYIDGGTPQIWHNTFAHNTANSGSGVYRAGGVMDIRGNIFVNGTGDVLVDGGSGSAGLIAYNNIANNAGANGSMEGTNIVTDDPQLIVDREGAEVTYRIDLTSPAFDAGDDSLFAHLQVDFENHIRPSHQTMDLGADEIDGCYAWINEDISQVYGSPQYAIDLVGSEPNIVDVAGICYGANNRNGTAQNLYIDKDLDLRGGWDVSIINNDLSTFTFTNRVTKTILNPLTEGRGLTLSGTNSIIIDRFHVYNGLLTSEDGGGLYNNNTDTFLRNNVFYNNLARNGG
ncbi:MAG: choice-of-anchor Q domain-containing protein, partial [Chloroflexota bacterium]